jgi:hypothetical protein
MTEALQNQSFGRYLAVRKAVAAHGLSDNFEERPNFATIPSSAAADLSAPAVIVYPRISRIVPSAGKTFIVGYTGMLVKPFEIVPATLITSKALETLGTFDQSGSMATQQPPITEDESVEEIIWRVGTTFSVRYRARLTSRLIELQKAVQEDELDGRGITVRSLHHFVEFLKMNPALRCPAVSVTPDRNIYASWKSGPDRVFSVHFLPDGEVRFVIFCPNDKHPGETVRISGTATVDVVMTIAVPHGVLSWISDERSANPRF